MERLGSQKCRGGGIERANSVRERAKGSCCCNAPVFAFFCGVCLSYPLFAFTSSTFSLYSHKDKHNESNLWKKSPIARPQHEQGRQEKKKIDYLQSLWEAHYVNLKNGSSFLANGVGEVPKAPHIQDCEAYVNVNKQLDSGGAHWRIWKGYLGVALWKDQKEEPLLGGPNIISQAPHPPWVEGGDEDNLPMTRHVQQDLWLQQHPSDCQDPHLRFLLTDWESNPGFGIGAQIAGMAGMFALAVNQKRILVTNYFNRADHEGCAGSVHSRWSCYFLPETSAECRNRALELASQAEAWEQGLITTKQNYSTKEIWVGKIPRKWGKPWERMQPTTEIQSRLLKHHRARDRRWWRAQAVRYLMRFQTEYTCKLLNIARHHAFGTKAAKMVLQTLPPEWPEMAITKSESEVERYVWTNHKPWAPRPLLSIHVRLGDKAAEMKIFGFQSYMNLAKQIQNRFPDVKNIWLSTEMQEVVEQSKSYTGWNFYFTNVRRQFGNMTMPAYEASLGRETSTNYPLVNFLMAADADFFVGALGSTWCYLIDGMRSTGGKVMAGYLSVNKDRFW